MRTGRRECSRIGRPALALALAIGLGGAAALSAGTATVRPGVPNVGGQARYTGTHGLEVNVASPDRGAAYVQTSHPATDRTYRARFYLNLRGLTMGNNDELDVFVGYSGSDPTPPTTTGNAVVRVTLRGGTGGQKLLTAFARRDNGSESEIAAEVPLVDGWRLVEIDWAAATAAGANNGRLGLWVDGLARTGLSSLDNDQGVVNYARLGSVTGADAGTSGTFDLDDFASQRTGYLGPVSVFSDVATSAGYWSYVHGLYAAEITTGCASGQYCPSINVSRAEMAPFLTRVVKGPEYAPGAAVGVFSDVDPSHWSARWIEQIYADGITQGCGVSPLRYCPFEDVSRADMAIFLLRAKYGAGYTPPPASGTVFADVPASHRAAAWIEQLADEGITTGCGDGSIYCPSDPVTRWQMAIFLVRAFSLPIQQVGP
jgi:hypothetical protein